jgi:hypothetical protein
MMKVLIAIKNFATKFVKFVFNWLIEYNETRVWITHLQSWV